MKNLKKILLVSVVVGSLFASNVASAGWVSASDLSGDFKYVSEGSEIIRLYNLPQYSQENSYSCGATTIAMQIVGETNKYDNAVRASNDYIYNIGKSVDGRSQGTGFASWIMPDIINKVSSTLNNLGYENHVDMRERGNITTKAAVKRYWDNYVNTKSPGIMYGNVGNYTVAGSSYTGNPGMHYYLIRGVVNCDHCQGGVGVYGLYLNDSVYKSSYYKNHSLEEKRALQNASITPRTFVLTIKQLMEAMAISMIN